MDTSPITNDSIASAISAVTDAGEGGQTNLQMLMEVGLQLTVELGQAQMSVRQVLGLQEGSVVELNRQAGEAVDIFINNQIFARGEVVVVDDMFGVRITELMAPGIKRA